MRTITSSSNKVARLDFNIQELNKLKSRLFIRMACFQSFGDLDRLFIRNKHFYPPLFDLLQFPDLTYIRICALLRFKLSCSEYLPGTVGIIPDTACTCFK